jgi:hypothetical protein
VSNEVTIEVKSKDKTDFSGMTRDAKDKFSKVGDEAGKSLGASAKRSSEKGGDDAGRSFFSSLKKWFGGAEKEGSSSGGKTGKGFGSSLKKWFAGEGGGIFSEIGKSGGTVFGSGLLGAIKTPILGPAILAIFGGVIATVMPAIGALAGGALVLGFGAGLAGLGLMMAAKSQAVKEAWAKTLGQVGADMQLISKPFESTLIQISGTFRRTVDAFNPYLQRAFSKMAAPIAGFADDAGHALEGLTPAVGPLTDAFISVLHAVGGALPGAVKSLTDGLTELANSVNKNPQALADLVTGIGNVANDALHLITVLNDVNTGFSDMTGGLSLVDVTMAAVGALIGPLTLTFTALGKGIDLVNAALGRNGENADVSGKSMADAAAKTVALANAHGELGPAAHGAADGTAAAAKAAADDAKKAADAKAATEAWITSLFTLKNLTLGLSGAQISYQQAVDDASASVKENGRQHDINTAKGRANKTALDSVASSANAQTEAMLRSGRGTASAASTAEKSRTQFIQLAQKMGYNKQQAEAMAAAMIAIPNVSREAKLVANKKDLEDKLAAARHALADPKLTATKKAKLEAEVSRLMGAVNAAQNKIDSLHGKTVGITIKYSSTGVNLTTPSSVGRRWAGGTVRGFSGGGTPAGSANREFLVGEEGPEILTMSGGQGHVTPAGDTARRLRGGGGTQTVVLEWAPGVGGRLEDLLMGMFREYVKVRGGNVQEALS